MGNETIRSGGLEYEADWISCQARASFKPDEALVRIQAVDVNEPLGFFVDSELVTPRELSKILVDGAVKVIVVERNGGISTVAVPGEPISFGPRISISNELFRAAS